MDDDFLHKFRKGPRPEFSRSLYRRINQPMNSKPVTRRVLTSWKTAFAALAAVVVVALVVSPAARAVAQDFLNLFRVRRFAAISVDPARISQLQEGNVDLEALIGASSQVLKDPGKPQLAENPQAASQLAGFAIKVPASLPPGAVLQDIQVQGEGSVRFTADTAKLQAMLEALGVTDVQVPPALNGATVTVNKPPMVAVTYRRGQDKVVFVQSHNPQIELPAGVDMAQLGEIALRVTGMAPDEARRFAQSIDWTSTLLVPVPANASSFREVEVRGVTGLLITTSGGSLPTANGPRNLPQGSVLLWAEGDMVYAMSGNVPTTLVDMANSIQ